MTRYSGCPHLWEVEAARDGRLRGDALRSHEAHRQDCPVCGSETLALDELAEQCKEVGRASVDEVALRRLRDEVLEHADARVVGLAHRRRPKPVVWVLAAAIAAVVAVWIAWPMGNHAPEAVTASLDVKVQPGPGARWNRETKDGFETFRLDDGTLALKVHRTPGARKVVVVVPDGKIEDQGTVFEVEVRAGRTERVVVEEGAVSVSLNGGVDVLLHAGEAWRRPVPPVVSAVASSARAEPAGELVELKPRATVKPPSAPATAMDDAAAEDEAYLQVVALLRAGKHDQARAAARSYLEEFPNGFRRDEMVQVASGTR